MAADMLELQPGDYLVREGDESTQMYFLQAGSLAIMKVKGGAERQIGTVYTGEIVGEMSFLDKEPRSASVKAISASEVAVIPSEKFEKLISSQPSWYRALVNTLLDRLRKANF